MMVSKEVKKNSILIAVVMMMFLMMSCMISYVHAQLESSQLTIRVVDPSGNPLEKIEVTISKDAESYRFLTNSTGYAVFTGLSEGMYNIQAKLDKVIVARDTVNFPSEVVKTIIANISNLVVKLVDLDGKPVPSAQVRLVSVTKLAEYSGETNQAGQVTFSRIPYTSLSDIKGYKLTVSSEGHTILNIDNVEIVHPKQELDYTLPLLSLNITTLNMEGEQVSRANVKLQAANYTKTMRTDKGTARFTFLPSSSLEWVKEYTINVTYALGQVEYTVYSSKRTLTSSQSLDLILELATLRVKVVDEEGNPLKNVRVSLSNQRSQNFTQQQTDEDGEAIFRNIPLSVGVAQAGEYIVQAFKVDKKVSESRVSLSSSEATITLTIVKPSIELTLRDYNKNPLVGYNVTLNDLDTGDRYTATTGSDGRISLKMFPGRYSIEIYKDSTVFYRDQVTIRDTSITLEIQKINFPFTLKILDAFDNPIQVGVVTIRIGNQRIYEGPLESLNMLTMPYAGILIVDYRVSDTLIWRETILADGPGEYTIRIDSYASVFGSIIPMETLGILVSISLSIIMLSAGGFAIFRSTRRRLITKHVK